MQIIKALLNHPGERSLNTIAKINQCTRDRAVTAYNMYIDACKHAIEISSDDDEREIAKNDLNTILNAYALAAGVNDE